MAIKSSKFSFVRFGDDFQQGCADINYILPVVQNFEVAFQFEPDGDVAAATEYPVSVATVGCTDPVDLGVVATMLNRKAKLTLSQPGDFFLQTVTYGEITNDYNVIVTLDEFLDILAADFGIEATADEDGVITFYTICDFELSFTASTEPDGAGEAVTGEYAMFYGKGYVDLSDVDVGSVTGCFRLQIDGTCSNKFIKITDPCYTSLFVYSCKESAFGFVYPDTPNKVRLQAQLLKPTWPKTKVVYRKSNGRNLLLSSVVDKVYSLVTDHYPEGFHECMAIALSHDDVIIQNTNIREVTVEVLEADDYAASWNDDDVAHNADPVAQGKGKLKVAKYSYSNSNCGVPADPCAQDVPVPGVCDPIDGELVITFGDPSSVSFTPATTVPEGDAIYITFRESSDGITYIENGACTLVCSDPGGCSVLAGNIFSDPYDPDTKCYAATIERICGYATSGNPIYSASIEKLAVGGTCDDIPPDPPDHSANVIMRNNMGAGVQITNVIGVPDYIFDVAFPVSNGETLTHLHGTGAMTLKVTITGTPGSIPSGLVLTINGVFIQCINVSGAGEYTFGGVMVIDTDEIDIHANFTACP